MINASRHKILYICYGCNEKGVLRVKSDGLFEIRESYFGTVNCSSCSKTLQILAIKYEFEIERDT